MNKNILKYESMLTSLRRDLHKIPEVGFEEFKTHEYIVNFLSKLDGLKISTLATTGIKAVLDIGAKETFAFRADIDALFVEEKNDIEFVSTHKGFMHACGHDGHTAMLMTLAAFLSENKDKLDQNIVFVFQPAEESTGGATVMIDEGVLDSPKVSRIYAFHIWPAIPQGKIGVRAGGTLAATTEFNIDIWGKSSHGASPQSGIDTIVAAASIIEALQTVVTKNISPTMPAVLNVGKLTAGTVRNVVADHARIEGILRSFDNDMHIFMEKRIDEITKGHEKVYGVKAEFSTAVKYPVVYNDANLVKELYEILDEDVVFENDLFLTAEDFAEYQKHVPGVLMLLGAGNEEKGFTNPLHSSCFNFDEKIMLLGLETVSKILKIELEEN